MGVFFKTKLGTLYHKECLSQMNEIPDSSIDCIICDLPYGTTQCKWDIVIPFEALWHQYNRIIKPHGAIVLFGSEPFASKLRCSNLKYYKYDWIWEKTQGTGFFNANKQPLRCYETISVFYKKQCIYNPQKTQGHKPTNSYTKYLKTVNKTQVYGKCSVEISGGGETDRYPRNVIKFKSDKQSDYLHPTQKPLALIEYLIKTYTNEGDLILDNCLGSGTLAVGCENLNRRWIGIENNLEYCSISKQRLILNAQNFIDCGNGYVQIKKQKENKDAKR